jgi:hypothetical protein
VPKSVPTGLKTYRTIIKTFDIVPKERFDLVPKLTKTFDLVIIPPQKFIFGSIRKD